MQAVLFSAKKYLSFKAYKDVVEFAESTGQDMGAYCRSEWFAKSMSVTMSDVFLNQFLTYLRDSDVPFSAIMGKCANALLSVTLQISLLFWVPIGSEFRSDFVITEKGLGRFLGRHG